MELFQEMTYWLAHDLWMFVSFPFWMLWKVLACIGWRRIAMGILAFNMTVFGVALVAAYHESDALFDLLFTLNYYAQRPLLDVLAMLPWPLGHMINTHLVDAGFAVATYRVAVLTLVVHAITFITLALWERCTSMDVLLFLLRAVLMFPVRLCESLVFVARTLCTPTRVVILSVGWFLLSLLPTSPGVLLMTTLFAKMKLTAVATFFTASPLTAIYNWTVGKIHLVSHLELPPPPASILPLAACIGVMFLWALVFGNRNQVGGDQHHDRLERALAEMSALAPSLSPDARDAYAATTESLLVLMKREACAS